MKRLIFKDEVETFNAENIKDSHHVGILLISGIKMYIVKSKEGFFGMRIFDEDIRANWFAPSKISFLRSFKPAPQAFVFETNEALINWLKS